MIFGNLLQQCYNIADTPVSYTHLDVYKRQELGASSILRCPIIPGFNDRDGHFNSIAKLANQLRHVCMIHVEPYNSFGEGKAQSIGSQYALKLSLIHI